MLASSSPMRRSVRFVILLFLHGDSLISKKKKQFDLFVLTRFAALRLQVWSLWLMSPKWYVISDFDSLNIVFFFPNRFNFVVYLPSRISFFPPLSFFLFFCVRHTEKKKYLFVLLDNVTPRHQQQSDWL